MSGHEKGWVVHPLSSPEDTGNSPGKRPILREWQKLKKTPNNLHKYLDQGCNMGLVCGEASGVTVIDFDHALFWEPLIKDVGLFTRASQRTEGRGHVYFQYNTDLKSQKHHILGIEVLSNGSNAVLPPSKHVSGDTYQWINPDAPIAAMPAILVERLQLLFETEARLVQMIGDCRPCFRKLWSGGKPGVVHGADGREVMLAWACELKAKGAGLDEILMLARLVYKTEFSSRETAQEWKNIKTKPWTCKKIKERLSGIISCTDCKPAKKKREKKLKTINSDDAEALKKGLGVYRTIRQLADEAQKVQPVCYDEHRNYWMWEKKKKYWKRIDETTILCCIDSLCSENVIDSKFKNEIIEAFRITGRNRQVIPVPKKWLRFEDKVYDLETKKIFDPTPEYFYTAPIPHKIGISEETPTIDAIFSSWVSNPLDLEEQAAYCLVDEYPIHRIFILLGSGGNGKGQYMDFLSRLVGAYNSTSTDLVTVLTSRFEAAKMYRKKLALVGETDYKKIESTDKIKRITGDDWVQGEYKHKDPFDFKNTAKVFISANDLPETSDKTDAWYRRTVVSEFRNHYDDRGKSIIDTIPESEYENFCKKCIRILGELLERGKFTNEGTTKEKEEKYERLANPFPAFREKELNEDGEAETPMWVLREMFEVFCVKNGHRKRSEKEFTQTLHEHGYETKRAYWGKKKWTTVYGLSTKTPYVYINSESETNTDNRQDGQHGQGSHIRYPIGENVEPPCPSCPSCPEISQQEKITESSQQELIQCVRNELIAQAPHFPEGINEHLVAAQAYRWQTTEGRITATITYLIRQEDIRVTQEKSGIRYIKWAGW